MVDSFLAAVENQDPEQAKMMLAKTLKDANMDMSNPEQARKYIKDIKDTFDLLPDTPEMQGTKNAILSQAAMGTGGNILSNLSQGGNSGLDDKLIDAIVSIAMAEKISDIFGINRRQQSDIESTVKKRAVDLMMGEKEGNGGKLDEISAQLGRLNRKFESGEIGRGTAMEQLNEQAEKLQEQMETFEDTAETMGYSKENKGTLEKITDVSGKINELLGNLRKSAPSAGRGGQKPERKVKKAGGPEPKASPEERPGKILEEEEEEKPIPVQEEKPEKEVSEAEPEPEEGAESEGRPRDEKGRFLPEDKVEDKTSEESEE